MSAPDLVKGDLCVLLEFICIGFEPGKLVVINGPLFLCRDCRSWHYNIYEDTTDIVSAPRPYLRKLGDGDFGAPNQKIEWSMDDMWSPKKEVICG